MFIPAKHFRRGRISPVRLLVIHDMEAPEKSTTAEAIARYFADCPKKASAHWCIDNDSVVQSVRLEDTAFAAPGANADGIQYELAGYARQTREEWLDAYSRDVLRLTAIRMTADSGQYNIPLRPLSDRELAGGVAKGIVTHAQVSRVFKRSTHWDPGPGFPMDYLLERLGGQLEGPVADRPDTTGVPPFSRTLRSVTLDSNPARTWQRRMRQRGWRISVDGDYGPKSAEVCRKFQREKGLVVDGVVGPKTWAATWQAPVTG